MLVRNRPSVIFDTLVAKKNCDLNHVLSQKVAGTDKHKNQEPPPSREEMQKVKS